MLLFGIQHVLVMAATPISSVFLVSSTLHLTPALTANLLSAAFVLSGLGSLLQSLGPWGFGARLPFVMLPGGAPLILFLSIADQHGLRTACGAVIITAVFYFVVLPVFSRLLRFFPTLVIGTMIVIVGVNLVKVGALLVTGRPGSSDFGEPGALLLGSAWPRSAAPRRPTGCCAAPCVSSPCCCSVCWPAPGWRHCWAGCIRPRPTAGRCCTYRS